MKLMLIVTVTPNGPLKFEGSMHLILGGQKSQSHNASSIHFCRCGHNRARPFCDGSHLQCNFKDQGEVAGEYVVRRSSENSDKDVAEVSFIENGPIHIVGRVQIIGAKGPGWSGCRVKLCRCGRSAIKPFCDGAHKNQGGLGNE
jgi:CDGSH-type Zn-finger protein